MVSGSLHVSNSFVSPYSNSFVSHCGGWWCPALRMSPIHSSPLIAILLSPSLAGGVRLSACLQFICLPLKQFNCLPVWLVVSGSPDVSNSFVFPYSNSFVSQSGWWCLALCMFPIHLSPLIAIHLSPSLACGGISPDVPNSFVSPYNDSFCLPVWLVVSGSSAVSNSFVSAYSDSFVSQSGWWCPALPMSPFICLPLYSFVSQSGWWCPALCMSPIHLSPLIAIHLSPSLAGGVRLSGCLQFICLPL